MAIWGLWGTSSEMELFIWWQCMGLFLRQGMGEVPWRQQKERCIPLIRGSFCREKWARDSSIISAAFLISWETSKGIKKLEIHRQMPFLLDILCWCQARSHPRRLPRHLLGPASLLPSSLLHFPGLPSESSFTGGESSALTSPEQSTLQSATARP